MTTPEEKLEALLAGISKTGKKPCAVERNADLAAALRAYRKKFAAGETHVPLEHLYEKGGLKAAFDGPSMSTVRRWAQAEDAAEAKNG